MISIRLLLKLTLLLVPILGVRASYCQIGEALESPSIELPKVITSVATDDIETSERLCTRYRSSFFSIEGLSMLSTIQVKLRIFFYFEQDGLSLESEVALPEEVTALEILRKICAASSLTYRLDENGIVYLRDELAAARGIDDPAGDKSEVGLSWGQGDVEDLDTTRVRDAWFRFTEIAERMRAGNPEVYDSAGYYESYRNLIYTVGSIEDKGPYRRSLEMPVALVPKPTAKAITEYRKLQEELQEEQEERAEKIKMRQMEQDIDALISYVLLLD